MTCLSFINPEWCRFASNSSHLISSKERFTHKKISWKIRYNFAWVLEARDDDDDKKFACSLCSSHLTQRVRKKIGKIFSWLSDFSSSLPTSLVVLSSCELTRNYSSKTLIYSPRWVEMLTWNLNSKCTSRGRTMPELPYCPVHTTSISYCCRSWNEWNSNWVDLANSDDSRGFVFVVHDKNSHNKQRGIFTGSVSWWEIFHFTDSVIYHILLFHSLENWYPELSTVRIHTTVPSSLIEFCSVLSLESSFVTFCFSWNYCQLLIRRCSNHNETKKGKKR